ncbi:MAG TPA: PadR family transcriptional regulator [Micromonosporaceae bacterium]|jgi:DNA-binding PadR family transcriptional regulator
MAKRRPVRNLLGLAVLAALYQRPMHPYEIAKSLRDTGKERDMGVKWGSFYTVIGNLEKYGLIESVESYREGNRPERTTYRITDEGRAELVDWVRDLVASARPEESGFRAGLSVLTVLHPDDATVLLRQRVEALEARLAAEVAEIDALGGRIPRLFLIESEYDFALLRAEIDWTRSLADEFAAGTFPDLAGWRMVHETGELPPEIAELMNE